MITFVHCSDLHLTAADPAEREYSLSVLDEIVELAASERAAGLFFCGDLFNHFKDAEELREEFRKRIQVIRDRCRIIYVIGNHEVHGIAGQRLGSYDFGQVTVVEQGPFSLTQVEGVEVLCIPHQARYDGYRDWQVPAKASNLRIALAHGLVTGMEIYLGPDEEGEPPGVLDPDLFAFHKVDYAALGHIHGRREATLAGVRLCYAGSARVYRKGETDARGVYLLRVGDKLEVQFHPLEKAGQYRAYDLPLSLEGRLEGLDELAFQWGPKDWIDLRLSGVVDDENVVGDLERRLKETHGPRVRRFDVDRTVQPLSGISSHPLAKKFLEVWESRFSSEGRTDERLWKRARLIGLVKLAELVKRSS
ncbi:MAG: hypothetical protein GYA21_16755 [Myxococcales bacterium]|nr:hypothetical protein [Myxococcales bacterium]